MDEQRRERLAITPAERRAAVLGTVAAARRRLALSIFRCTDFEFVDALGSAIDRGVTVEALLAARRHRWRDEPDGLPRVLRRLGVCVHMRPAGATPYHAKYLVADEGAAFVGTLNWTRRHFDRTCDFGVITHDPTVVRGVMELFEVDRRGFVKTITMAAAENRSPCFRFIGLVTMMPARATTAATMPP